MTLSIRLQYFQTSSSERHTGCENEKAFLLKSLSAFSVKFASPASQEFFALLLFKCIVERFEFGTTVRASHQPWESVPTQEIVSTNSASPASQELFALLFLVGSVWHYNIPIQEIGRQPNPPPPHPKNCFALLLFVLRCKWILETSEFHISCGICLAP